MFGYHSIDRLSFHLFLLLLAFGIEPETLDRLCGLVVRVADYKHRGPGFDSRDFSEGVGSGTGSTQPRDQIN
jgi:hypothetical protein